MKSLLFEHTPHKTSINILANRHRSNETTGKTAASVMTRAATNVALGMHSRLQKIRVAARQMKNRKKTGWGKLGFTVVPKKPEGTNEAK